jgi:hypothetical protein
LKIRATRRTTLLIREMHQWYRYSPLRQPSPRLRGLGALGIKRIYFSSNLHHSILGEIRDQGKCVAQNPKAFCA